MRCSDDPHLDYQRARRRHAGKSITCYWFRRGVGIVGQRVEITLNPAQCQYFQIWMPRLLQRKRAERIAAWGAAQQAKPIVRKLSIT